MNLPAGTEIKEKYRVVRLLGEGGMGVVVEATNLALGTPVALKLLRADLALQPGLRERFLREAQIAAQIASPHVAQVYDIGTTEEGIPFLVMELLRGETLRALLDKQGRLPAAVACDFALQILAGLSAAHALGIVHRDLKPDNVYLVPGPAGQPLLKLLDFGVAKLEAPPTGRGLTKTGTILGTPEYMAPEQATEAAHVDARADVYSLGAMLYEMLSGEPIFRAPSIEAALLASQFGPRVPLEELTFDLPSGLATVIARSLALEPAARFQSAQAFAAALAPFASTAASKELSRLPPQAAVAHTERVAPGVIEAELARASTLPAPSVGPGPQALAYNAGSALQPALPPSAPQGRTRGRRYTGLLVVLVALAALLGGAMLWLQFGQGKRAGPSQGTVTIALPTATATPTVVPEVTHSPVPPVLPGPPFPTPTLPKSPTAPKATNNPPPTPPAASSNPQGPITLPLPSGLPSGFPTAFTIPTALPTELPQIPGLPPLFPPPAPAPQNDAPSPGAPP
jgi:serine/threonine protein kinase